MYLILDNAGYYHSKEAEAYRQQLGKITFIFLPTYSPNLNLMERLWKFFKKKTTDNKYYEKYADFVDACKKFLQQHQKTQGAAAHVTRRKISYQKKKFNRILKCDKYRLLFFKSHREKQKFY
ncbi:MAG: transposase [Planctomycetaceae bacterium]|nr:transposase [Planctomycetaceae bacterium]